MKLNKIAIAAAALAATFTGGFATAGSFQANSTTIAREVIVSDAQLVVAPQVSYSFQGPVRNPGQDTYFQIQLKLDGGAWSVPLLSGFPTVPHSGGAAGNGNVALVDSAGLVIATANAIRVDDQLIKATFQVPRGAGVNNARVIFNAAGTNAWSGGAAISPPVMPHVNDRLYITKLKSVVGDVSDCDDRIMKITGSITQYPDITDPSFTATAANDSPASEHKYPGSQNSGPVTSFPTNLLLSGKQVTPIAVQDYSFQAKRFKHIDPNTTPHVSPSGYTVTLGTVQFDQKASGYDTDLTTVYGGKTPINTRYTASSALTDGTIEAQSYTVVAKGNFAETGRLWVTTGACVDGDYAGAAPITAGATSAAVNFTGAALTKGVVAKLCYGVDGSSVIPTTAFAGQLILKKAPDNRGAADVTRFQEQDNSCNASYSVGGGIRIDVRNYASVKKFGPAGVTSTIRIINNSETATADLYAQMIYADGTYGAWGELPPLAPRAAANYSSAELESYMKNKAAANNPFGGNATGYATDTGNNASVIVQGNAAHGDRVRIVSTTGSTLRVQSYMQAGSMIIDTSGAQGVDFEGLAAPSNGRAPTVDAQPNSQDAINGLAR